jgi:hypothetical protein
MAAFLDKYFVGQLPFGVHKVYVWALGLLWFASAVLAHAVGLGSNYENRVFHTSPALLQLVLTLAVLAVLAVLLVIAYRRSVDSVRTLLWDGTNPVIWFLFWLSAGGLIDNYTRFPFIVAGLVAFGLQIVLIQAFVRAKIRTK